MRILVNHRAIEDWGGLCMNDCNSANFNRLCKPGDKPTKKRIFRSASWEYFRNNVETYLNNLPGRHFLIQMLCILFANKVFTGSWLGVMDDDDDIHRFVIVDCILHWCHLSLRVQTIIIMVIEGIYNTWTEKEFPFPFCNYLRFNWMILSSHQLRTSSTHLFCPLQCLPLLNISYPTWIVLLSINPRVAIIRRMC